MTSALTLVFNAFKSGRDVHIYILFVSCIFAVPSCNNIVCAAPVLLHVFLQPSSIGSISVEFTSGGYACNSTWEYGEGIQVMMILRYMWHMDDEELLRQASIPGHPGPRDATGAKVEIVFCGKACTYVQVEILSYLLKPWSVVWKRSPFELNEWWDNVIIYYWGGSNRYHKEEHLFLLIVRDSPTRLLPPAACSESPGYLSDRVGITTYNQERPRVLGQHHYGRH